MLLLNKPHGVVCQFTASGAQPTLKNFVAVPHVYPAGRLDTDSEGLVVLTDDGAMQALVSNPRYKLPKLYLAQVEGEANDETLEALAAGVELNDGVTRPARARRIDEPPGLWMRDPPIRVRRNIPTSWIEIEIAEGRNRQVRRMTAAVGLPTLRLVRWRVGPWSLEGIAPGTWREALDRPPIPRRAAR